MHSHLRITHGSAHGRKGWRHHDASVGLLRKNDIEHRRDFPRRSLPRSVESIFLNSRCRRMQEALQYFPVTAGGGRRIELAGRGVA